MDPAAIAEAVEQRVRQTPQGPSPAQIAAEYAKRQHFRRLIDPGILRPNSKGQALESMKILYKLSANLIQEPDNPKFRRFKTTNSQIQKHVMDPKGTVEYVRELGFHPEVIDFQPYFTFNPSRISDLKIGNAILKEALDLQEEKKEREAVAKQAEKAAREGALQKIHLAFIDDRKSKSERDERERQSREARAARAAAAAAHQGQPEINASDDAPSGSSEDGEHVMPGSGHLLGGGDSTI